MTSGEALADSIIIKKKSKSSFSGVRAPAFSETKESCQTFFLDACCWLPVWQTVTSEQVQPTVVAINKNSFSYVSLLQLSFKQ